MASIQFFAAQILVARKWSPPYNLARDTISDLGNTSCGNWNAHFVCSPFHDLMNASLIMLGTCMVLGSALISSNLASSRATVAGFAGMTASGAGVMMAGVFPENSIPAFHGLGTAVAFLAGNTGLVVLAFALKVPVVLRAYSFTSGALALLALVSYASGHYAGLGEGGIERVVAYPLVVWLTVTGLYFMIEATRRGGRAHARTSGLPGGTGTQRAAATRVRDALGLRVDARANPGRHAGAVNSMPQPATAPRRADARPGSLAERTTTFLAADFRRPSGPVLLSLLLAAGSVSMALRPAVTVTAGFTVPLAVAATAPLAMTRRFPSASLGLVLAANACYLLFPGRGTRAP